MLKGKKAVYILIPLNILIWGFFIYRFISAYYAYDEPLTQQSSQGIKLEVTKDSIAYKLNLKYPDPFLKKQAAQKNYGGSNFVSQNQPKQVAPKQEPIKKPEPVKAALPDIKYLGIVKNSSSGFSTAIVSINGQSRIIKANETFDGILFKSFDNNELIASFGKEKIVVRK